MTLNELKKEVEKYIKLGFGEKEIFIDSVDENYAIDSIQRNTMPEVEPEYLIILPK